tara:strand:- start:591 stop:935 length:345 start_codon:yes stop_codon:yes gene_type:complete
MTTIDALMILGQRPLLPRTTPGRMVSTEPPIKRGPKPLADRPMPKSIQPGTRPALIWRVLPDADDVPLSSGEIALPLRLPTTTIAPALMRMVKRGVAERYTDADGAYSYTRPEA